MLNYNKVEQNSKNYKKLKHERRYCISFSSTNKFIFFFITLFLFGNSAPLLNESNINLKNETTKFLNNFITNTINKHNFNENCSDIRYKEIHCYVTSIECLNFKSTNIIENGPAPGQAHDIRIESFAKALSIRSIHQLTVDISWQILPNNSTKLLFGFLIEIIDTDNPNQNVGCFLFNISKSNWTSEIILLSPRLHFLTTGIFQFSKTYDITFHSLPASKQSIIKERFTTPNNPHLLNRKQNKNLNNLNEKFAKSQFDNFTINSNNKTETSFISPSCIRASNPYASKWAAGFRRIFLHSLARSIQIEFVGAPPQYCFEQYEIRLLDETAIELIHSGIVSVSEMKTEFIDNNTVIFGEFNFTNLELEQSYIPSVIPVERAQDGRCLCPVYGSDPYDNKVVCSCIAADWKPIRLSRLNIVQNDCLNCGVNSTFLSSVIFEKTEDLSNKWQYFFLFFNIVFFIFLICFGICVLIVYQRRNKRPRIRLIKNDVNALLVKSNKKCDFTKDMENLSGNNGLSHPSLITLTNYANNNTIEPGTELLNVLLIYAHDSLEHDASVYAFAELLRDAFGIQVELDKWNESIIERNIMDYLSSSVINADKIIIINSFGALNRFYCKIANNNLNNKQYIIERTESVKFDDLFIKQIDMALQHHCIVSVRFTGTPIANVLPILSSRLQYVLPDNLAPLMTALLRQNIRNDYRLNHQSVARFSEAVRALNAKVYNDLNWFIKTHCRRLVLLDAYSIINVNQLWNGDKININSESKNEIDPQFSSIIASKALTLNLLNQTNQENITINNQQNNSTKSLCNFELNNDVISSNINNSNEIFETISSKISSETINTINNDAVSDYCLNSVPSINIDLNITPSKISDDSSDKTSLNNKKILKQQNSIDKNFTDSLNTLSSLSINGKPEEVWQNEVADSGVFTNTFDETKQHLKNDTYFIAGKTNDQTNIKIQKPTTLLNEFENQNNLNKNLEVNENKIYQKEETKKLLNNNTKSKKKRFRKKKSKIKTEINKLNVENNNKNLDSGLIPDENFQLLIDQYS